LLRKQIGQYEGERTDWRKVAKQRIFPALPGRIRAMRLARKGLLEGIRAVFRRAQQRFSHPELPIVVIYVGIGLGAG